MLMDALRSGLSDRCEVDVVTGTEGIESSDRVRVHRGLTPADPGLRRLFDEADLFVLPTRADCSPLAIVEAMAAGLPVVTTDVGAISEQIVDGETGLLTRPGDPADLGHALATLLDDPELLKAYGEAGRRRAERCFDGKRNYATLMDLLKRSAGFPTSSAPTTPDDEGSRRIPIEALNRPRLNRRTLQASNPNVCFIARAVAARAASAGSVRSVALNGSARTGPS